MRRSPLRLCASFTLTIGMWVLPACGDETASPTPSDVGHDADDPTDDPVEDPAPGDMDAADIDGPAADLGVVHAFSADGSRIGLLFSADLAEAAAETTHYTVSAGNDDTREVIETAVDGDLIMLTLDEGLDPDELWSVSVSGVLASNGHVLAEDPTVVSVMGRIHLNLIWHQHQPSYLDPGLDELQGPWVRKHATKDYFDMTAILRGYPDIHLNVNLTSSLLNQLDLYLERLGPHVDVQANTVDEEGFLAEYRGHTDPWIDLLLDDTPDPGEADDVVRGRYYDDIWSTRSVAEPLRTFFPEYQALLELAGEDYTRLDLLYLKVYFEIAWMDPDFLTGPVTVYTPEGEEPVVVDLSDVVVALDEGGFALAPYYTTGAADDAERLERGEALANRLVAENYKIMRGVYAIHRELLYTGESGQVEVLTTPFYHPILPLLFDTDLASQGQPADPLPEPHFAYPEDVAAQIAMAVEFYTRRFGQAPIGMWPSEGSVAEEIVPAFVDHGIEWITTDRQVLERGLSDASYLQPYRLDADTVEGDGGDTDDEMMIVFRDTALADKVSFHFQGSPADENAHEFLADLLAVAPRYGQGDRLLTVIADGENAWEWFTQDHDAKGFFHATYALLSEAQDLGMLLTVTGSEYLTGNEDRGAPAHPLNGMAEYEDLWPGSWIAGTLSTWIGEAEENLGWTYLRTAREAMAETDEALEITLDSLLDPPDGDDAAELAWWHAWQAMYAAEGSDWFWWYGSDQTAVGGDSPFDQLFRAQLVAVYTFMNEARVASDLDPLEIPAFPPVLQPEPTRMDGPFLADPTLDGEFTPDEGEWLPPGGAFYDNDSGGADVDPDDDLFRVLFGFRVLPAERQRISLALEFNEDIFAKLDSDYRVAVYTSHQHAVEGDDGPELETDPANAETAEGLAVDFLAEGVARQIRIDFAETTEVTLWSADGDGGWDEVMDHDIQLGGPVEGGQLLELSFMMATLGMAPGDPLEILVVVSEAGEVIDVAPNIGSQVIFADPTNLVTVIMQVDATGDVIPIDEYVTIANPPPPGGTGVLSIVGNQPEIANWTPNEVFMLDDGSGFDLAGGDGIWTRSFILPPGTTLQYKYTIGTSADEGNWGGTEEYPLTNRAYLVPAADVRQVRVRDIFADRPDPSGTMADLTTVTEEE